MIAKKLLIIFGLVSFSSLSLAKPVKPYFSLLDIYNDAVIYNSDLAAAKAEYEAKQEAVPQAVAGLLPTLTAGASTETNHITVQQPERVHRRRSGSSFQANLNQAIFRLDRWFQLRAANASVAQAELEYANKEQLLILQTAEYYFETLRAIDELATSTAEEKAYLDQLKQTKGKLQGGIATITDVLDAQSAYDTANANRKIAEKKVQDGYEQLTRLTRRYYGQIAGISHKLPVSSPTPNQSEHWTGVALRRNFAVLAAEYSVKAANETYKQRQAGHAPTIDFVASARKGNNDAMGYVNTSIWSTYTGNVKQSSVSLQLNIPIFSGGLISSQAREARKSLLQNEELYETQQRETLLKTRNYFRALNSDIEQIKSRKKTVLSSYEALKANEIGVRVGTRNMMDVLNAQRQLYAAVRAYNNARYDYILDNLRLKQMAGILIKDDLKFLNDYLLARYKPNRDFLPPELISLVK